MKLDLKKPCSNCPFRTDIKQYLYVERREELASVLSSGGAFSCHKTNSVDEEGGTIETAESQHCAGALIVLENEREKPDDAGCLRNNLARVSARFGFFNPNDLDTDAPVFKSFDDWVDA